LWLPLLLSDPNIRGAHERRPFDNPADQFTLSMTPEPHHHISGEIRHGRHVLAVRVYYEDTDFTGVVYHASYLRFMERGRTDFMRLLGADQRALFEETAQEVPGFHFVVRSMTIEFLKSAHMDDLLEITTVPEEIKGASMTLRQRVARGAETLVEAKVRVAFVAGGKARRIPKALRQAMRAHEYGAAAPVGWGHVTRP